MFLYTFSVKFITQRALLMLSMSIAVSIDVGNETDYLALLNFKSRIVNDPQNVFSSWNQSGHFCDWQGVTCGVKHRRVTRINLPSTGLVGYLSPYIGNLSFLEEIVLADNDFQGRIPSEIGRLSRLQVLNLSRNFLEGEVPENLSYCSNLSVIAVGANKLTGVIPASLASLSKLSLLILHSNTLTGSLRPFIGNLTSLVSISVAYNNLSGDIPDEIGNCKSLQRIGLAGNNLSGEVPQSLYNLSALTVLSLSQNNLQGSIRGDIGIRFPGLQWFQIWGNKFSGSIPISLSNASGLQLIEMQMNAFTGKVAVNFAKMGGLTRLNLARNMLGTGDPDELNFLASLVNCTELEAFGFNHNQLKGVLPDSLSKLSTKLSELTFGDNRFYGNLPYGIGNLVSLTMLSMQNGKFSGRIPDDLGQLHNLNSLYLGSNYFSGEIPSSLGNLLSLNTLCLDDNKLQGQIPASLGNSQSLLLLNLSQNRLSGTIPKQIFTISSLSILLNLAHNKLSGLLPSEIHNLVHLKELDVSHNQLSGKIPSGLGDCNSLESLRINGNLFKGNIPSWLNALRGLQSIDFSQNYLSGEVPQFLELLSLTYLNLSFNNLEGQVPVKGIFSNQSAISLEGNNKLCGGNPELDLPKCSVLKLSNRPKISHKGMIFLVVSVVCTIFGIIVILSRVAGKRKVLPTSFKLQNESIRWVPYEKLHNATNEFSIKNLVGVGSFGVVYKGILDEDASTIAVKVFKLHQHGALKSFIVECEALKHIRHRNLVKIITCCSGTDFQGNEFKALVYEFMSNGSLETWLHPLPLRNHASIQTKSLSLRQRVSIAIDVATALNYLHHQCHRPIVHCDLKPSNILLDDDMIAHVGDFGIAKFLLPRRDSTNSSSIGVRGTIGYAAPEYSQGGDVSTKADVYSFGIILLEMMTGMKPTDDMFQEGLNLHQHARMALYDDRATEIVDPTLANNHEASMFDRRSWVLNCSNSIIKIGVACSMESPEKRMGISHVLYQLRLVKDVLSSYTSTVSI